MKNILKLVPVLLVIALMAFGTTANAQKIAYIVSEDIVPEMPAYKRAKSEVEAYGKQLQKILEAKQKEAQDFYQSTMEKAQIGELTPTRSRSKTSRIASYASKRSC
jgi:outer membrane protein